MIDVVSKVSTKPSLAALRVCMPTFTSFKREVFRTGLREAQDVLADCAEVEFVDLQPRAGLSVTAQALSVLVYHDATGRIGRLNPGLRRVRLDREYDIFMLVCPFLHDLVYANAIENWQEKCRVSICWLDELWAVHVPKLGGWLDMLARFDHVVVGVAGTGSILSKALGKSCHEVFGGVDTLRFTPWPGAPARVIDIYSVGRRVEAVHRALREFSVERGLFYLYDTLHSGDSQVGDHREHRSLYASLVRRSRLFMVAPGKVTRAGETGGQVDVGYRFFEGAGAGAVMLGQAPQTPVFRELFDWPNAVVEIAPDGSDAAMTIQELLGDPARLLAISSRNATEALLRHDWIYRWRQVLHLAGLPPTQAMISREAELQRLAREATPALVI